jgi:hypothetical protein
MSDSSLLKSTSPQEAGHEHSQKNQCHRVQIKRHGKHRLADKGKRDQPHTRIDEQDQSKLGPH